MKQFNIALIYLMKTSGSGILMNSRCMHNVILLLQIVISKLKHLIQYTRLLITTEEIPSSFEIKL